MRAVLQRVKWASVDVDGKRISEIGPGILLLIGFSHCDDDECLEWMANKVVNLRIFEDENGKMNRSVVEVGGSVLVVSQFTLYADCTKGRRPSFVNAAAQDVAERLYEDFLGVLRSHYEAVKSGIFQAHMEVSLCNDGPVTLMLDSNKGGSAE
ncbi:MAG TPA: D-tyrosyl-tRNA(Tyr) deacylase [Synergistaceae bacterium]|nr:D-tyrosyl-tRNA(Tyr) deacylase [Synergistaceae bacterium]